MKKTITLCSSCSFYREVIGLKNELERAGFSVLVPDTALKMEASGNFNVDDYKAWFRDPSLYHLKTERMDSHFKKVAEGDCILVVNLPKKGFQGYIGANVLLEMFYATLHDKPIYVLHPVDENLFCYEEVMGMNPIFIDGDLEKIG